MEDELCVLNKENFVLAGSKLLDVKHLYFIILTFLKVFKHCRKK